MDIDLSALKNINLSFLKKYASLVMPGIIVIVALLLLIPTVLIGNSLKENMKKSTQQSRTVNNKLSSVRSHEDAEIEQRYQDMHEADALQVELLAKQTTQRQLISYDIFPEPKASSFQIFSDYGIKYRESIEELFQRAGARGAPTENEIKRQLQQLGSEDKRKSGTATRSYNRKKSRRGAVTEDLSEAITDAFLKKHAQEISVYATPNLFGWYGFWKDYKVENVEDSIEDCWYSQLAFWVYEDIIDTIKSMNIGSTSVFTSDVKRLIGVNFMKHADYAVNKNSRYSFGGSGELRDADYPEYLVSDKDDSVFSFPPWTKRVSDDNVDVIHFSIAVLVDSRAVFPFMEELCKIKEHTYRGYLEPEEEKTFKHNQITIMQYWQESIDQLDKAHDKYRYGQGAIIKLTLTCEYIFNRAGYDEIKPASITKALEDTKEAIKKGSNNSFNMY